MMPFETFVLLSSTGPVPFAGAPERIRISEVISE